MKSARKLLALLLGLTSTLAIAGQVYASQVTRLALSLSDSRPSTSSVHTWTFTHTSAGTIKSIRFTYCTHPSGGCTTPPNLNTSGATISSLAPLTAANWTMDATTSPGSYYIRYLTGEVVSAGTPMTLAFSGVTNGTIGTNQANECLSDTAHSAATCYVLLGTYTGSDGATGLVDEGIASFTIVNSVEVTARVDPTFTFTVGGVAGTQQHNGITTTTASDFNTLHFGNLTAGTAKYMAQQLNVTTNTENGYTVTVKMLSQMTGIYSANNVDPFVGTGATWGAPHSWTDPNGTTPNDNTAWIGANTTGNDIAGWTQPATGLFGPVNATENVVMHGLNSDNGTVATFVSYAIEANVFQPADTYTGTLVYNALPTY
jgi:hypothetical protein